VVVPANEHGIPEPPVNLDHLQRIMSARLEEIFEIVHENLEQAGVLDDLHAGVFICGGGARIPRIQTLAERVFGLPAHVGRTNSISGLKSTLDQPEFATAIGLAKYGSMQLRRANLNWSLSGWLRGFLGSWFALSRRGSRPPDERVGPLPQPAAEAPREPAQKVSTQ
jgi:cell division ATPase FtsA